MGKLAQVGGLLSYNIIFPSDKPDIARLLGCDAVLAHCPAA